MTGAAIILAAAFTAWLANRLDERLDGALLAGTRPWVAGVMFPLLLPLLLWLAWKLWRAPRYRVPPPPPPRGKQAPPALRLVRGTVAVGRQIDEERRAA